MSDLIRRQDVIDAFYTQSDDDGWWTGTAQDAEELLKKLPSAEPDLSGYSDKLWRNAYERGKAEAQQWIPFHDRDITEEEREYYPDQCRILDCKLPEHGQRILVTIAYKGHEAVQQDEFYTDDGCYLDSGYDLVTEAIAWMPLPEPYKKEDE